MDKKERLIDAAAVVLKAAPQHELNAVTLNKVLFYLDLAALRDTGQVVTHNAYVALANGPVVARYQKRLIKALEDRGIAKQIERWDGAKPVRLISDPGSPAAYAPVILSLATKISQYFAGMTSGQASGYSHENPGWQIAWDKQNRLGKPVAINMLIALQQIVEDDPWIHVPMTVEESNVIDYADLSEGDDW